MVMMNKTHPELCDESLLPRTRTDRTYPPSQVTDELRIQVLEEFAAEQEAQALVEHHPIRRAEAHTAAMLARGTAYRLRLAASGRHPGELPPHA